MIHPRYPAPTAEKVWAPEARAHRMRKICDYYATSAFQEKLLGKDLHYPEFSSFGPVSVAQWEKAEQETGHEIVGFLAAYLERLPGFTHKYVHYGLTSSDLVEYDLHVATNHHALSLSVDVQALNMAVVRLGEDFPVYRAGRTHGQTAELTTLRHQMQVYSNVLKRLRQSLLGIASPVKSPGPTGYSELREANGSVPSTQVVPRDYLLEWACVYLRVANLMDSLATFIRLGCRSEIGEFREGAERVGSSAMPGKNNPIASEKVCGLARVARGHFLALAEVSNLWEDRDLSNSSTERISVPGLAATAEHMVLTMTDVIENLVVDGARIEQNARDPRTRTNAGQNWIQKKRGVGPLEASRIARQEPT